MILTTIGFLRQTGNILIKLLIPKSIEEKAIGCIEFVLTTVIVMRNFPSLSLKRCSYSFSNMGEGVT